MIGLLSKAHFIHILKGELTCGEPAEAKIKPVIYRENIYFCIAFHGKYKSIK